MHVAVPCTSCTVTLLMVACRFGCILNKAAGMRVHKGSPMFVAGRQASMDVLLPRLLACRLWLYGLGCLRLAQFGTDSSRRDVYEAFGEAFTAFEVRPRPAVWMHPPPLHTHIPPRAPSRAQECHR